MNAIVPTTIGVTSAVDPPHPVISWPSIENAVDSESARKKTHPTQTRLNVRMRCPHTRDGVSASGGRPRFARAAAAIGTQALSDTVIRAPEHERPRGAVPQAPEHHRHEDVQVRPELALLRAAERDVEVVAEPSAERHVPPAPEVLQRPGAVRPVEVLRELEAEELGHADRDVGVPAEVGVDHDRVSPDREQRLDRAVTRGIAEHRVDDRRRQEARDHHLLEQAAEDQPRGAPDVDVPRVASDVELGDQLVRAARSARRPGAGRTTGTGRGRSNSPASCRLAGCPRCMRPP